MMTPQLDPKLFLGSKPAVGPMPTNSTAPAPPQSKQASPLAMPAMSANAAPAMPMPQPKAANPNPLGTAFDIFARGFAPKQTAASDEKFKADGMERSKKALAWMQQTAGLPAEQRAAFTLQSAQDIARDTGQTYEAVVASARDPNAFSDDALKGAIATFSAQLGIAPETLTPAQKAQLEMDKQRFDYGKERDQSADEYRDTRDGVLDSRYTETFDYTKGRDETEDKYRERVFGETVRNNRASERIATAKAAAEALSAGIPDFGDENGLRTQYLGQAKTFQDVKLATDRVKALSPDLNPPEQMALIFSVMKMLDPSSTVRETEYANAQNTTGAYGSMWNYYNKMKDGEFLNDTQVKQFRNLVESQYKAAETSYGQTLDQYRGLAQRYRMDPSIIQDMRPPGAGPTMGEAEAARRRNAGAILGGTGEFNPETFRNMRLNNIPRDAVADLMSDPSPEAIAEFNDHFKMPGAAEAILNGNR